MHKSRSHSNPSDSEDQKKGDSSGEHKQKESIFPTMCHLSSHSTIILLPPSQSPDKHKAKQKIRQEGLNAFPNLILGPVLLTGLYCYLFFGEIFL